MNKLIRTVLAAIVITLVTVAPASAASQVHVSQVQVRPAVIKGFCRTFPWLCHSSAMELPAESTR